MVTFSNFEMIVKRDEDEHEAILIISPFTLIVPFLFEGNERYSPQSIYAKTMISMLDAMNLETTIYHFEQEKYEKEKLD